MSTRKAWNDDDDDDDDDVQLSCPYSRHASANSALVALKFAHIL